MNLKKYLFGFLCFIFIGFMSVQHVSAQATNITNIKSLNGKIMDVYNHPLSGVVVSVSGEERGAISNADGTFTILGVYKSTDEFTFKMLGYRTLITKLSEQTDLNVNMDRDVSNSNQVIPLLRDSRENYTLGASAVTISGDELRRTHQRTVSAALAGRFPGLYVTTNSSEPGNETYGFNIRGKSTVNGGGVKVLVDGMALGINSVRPEDVESVTVLKDAPALAQYGMDATGGIILIKTKVGESGRPKIVVSVDYQVQQALKTPDILSSGDYAELYNEASLNDGGIAKYTAEDISKFRSGEDRNLYPDNNWYERFTKPDLSSVNVNASATGGGEYVKYYTSIGYQKIGSPFNTESALEDYGRNKINLRSNVNVKVTDFIHAYVKLNATVDRNYFNNANGGETGVMSSLFDLAPTIYGPLTPYVSETNPGGKVVVTTNETNPTYGRLNRSGFKKTTSLDLTSISGLNFDLGSIIKGLSTFGEIKFHTYSNSNMMGNTDYERWTRDLTDVDNLEFFKYGTSIRNPLAFAKSVSNNLRFEYEWAVDYKRQFGNHGIHANAFFHEDYINGDNITEDLPEYKITYGFLANYSYKNFFFADFVGSYVGSEQFAPSERWGLFPSADAAVVLSNLSFMKDNNTLTFLKLRASYGIIGNDNFGGDRFLYKDNFHGGGSIRIKNAGKAYIEDQYGNPLLTWEKSYKTNFGIDASILNMFTLNFDYFIDNTDNILISDATIPSTIGMNSDDRAKINSGKIDSHGFEAALGWSKEFNKDFGVGLKGHVGYYQNEVKDLGELQNPEDYAYRYRKTGYRLGQRFAYQVDYSNGNGYFNSQDEIDNSGLVYQGQAPRPGDFIYKDVNGDGTIDAADQVKMGDTGSPQVEWGFEANLRFKNFDFSMLLQGLGKFDKFNNGVGYYSSYNKGTFFADNKNAWTAQRYADGSMIAGPALTLSGSSSYRSNDYWSESKAFWRIKNIEVGYSLPSELTKILSISNLRIYASAVNLLTFDNSKSGDVDIENNNVTNFPTQRYFSAGINVTF
ncbi:SusC/RagA family TonB-linked outer membrane protein [Flavobacterium ovatum]|uniref:SusC/RagA family TonB-linked outer membrane protein n=1 Tax=Flavobacterium ovatum TaxID=1928857 RepID=UPI00344C9031